MPTPMRSHARRCSGSTAPSTNCDTNSPNSARASRTLMLRFDSTVTANADCAAVRNSSSRCSESRGSPLVAPPKTTNTIGNEPTSSVHWLTFDDTSVPRPPLVLSRHAKRHAMSSSGASDASGASHCTSRNVLDAELLAGADERLGERLRTEQDHHGREREEQSDRDAAPAVGQLAEQACRTHQVGFLGRALADADRVEHEQEDQHTGVEQREVVLQRERERVQRGDREEGDLDAVRAVEADLGVDRALVALAAADPGEPPGRDEHDRGPPDADEQPVAAGHVGEGERRVLLGVAARLGREREVDDVLGEHGDQGQDGECEALRDVELEGLGAPGQDERGADDRQAVARPPRASGRDARRRAGRPPRAGSRPPPPPSVPPGGRDGPPTRVRRARRAAGAAGRGGHRAILRGAFPEGPRFGSSGFGGSGLRSAGIPTDQSLLSEFPLPRGQSTEIQGGDRAVFTTLPTSRPRPGATSRAAGV